MAVFEGKGMLKMFNFFDYGYSVAKPNIMLNRITPMDTRIKITRRDLFPQEYMTLEKKETRNDRHHVTMSYDEFYVWAMGVVPYARTSFKLGENVVRPGDDVCVEDGQRFTFDGHVLKFVLMNGCIGKCVWKEFNMNYPLFETTDNVYSWNAFTEFEGDPQNKKRTKYEFQNVIRTALMKIDAITGEGTEYLKNKDTWFLKGAEN